MKLQLKQCPRQRCKNKAIISPQFGVLPCRACRKKDAKIKLHQKPEFATLTQSDRINQQRDVHGADIIQPWTPTGKINRNFVKHYPDLAPEYFSEKQLKSL